MAKAPEKKLRIDRIIIALLVLGAGGGAAWYLLTH
jgi:hypothetical protein